MSNELIEFTAEEMRGCPPFGEVVNYFFEYQDSCGVLCGFYNEPRSESHYKCNPIDRCHAICKHLFELMPNAQKILIAGVEVLVMFEESFDELSINPFLHCDITEITREELGL